MPPELQRLQAKSYLPHRSTGLTSVMEMRVEIQELQGSSKDSTALCGLPPGSLSDAAQLPRVRQKLIVGFLPAFLPFHPNKCLEA